MIEDFLPLSALITEMWYNLRLQRKITTNYKGIKRIYLLNGLFKKNCINCSDYTEPSETNMLLL